MFKLEIPPDIKKIPASWILKNYFNIPEGTVKIKFKSIFNPEDKTPSMYIFEDNNFLKYKCFSTGKGGRVFDLMANILKKDLSSLYKIIIHDYINKKQSFKIDLDQLTTSAFTHRPKDVKYRNFNKTDLYYWGQYGITEKILIYHNVFPISYINLECIDKDGLISHTTTLSKNLMYGYHNGGELYKIYLPGNSMKFFSISTKFQGLDQCKRNGNLLITSSLKDIMAMRGIGITNIDMIAPPSETCYLNPNQYDYIKDTWDKVVVLFDNDAAGIKMMKVYRDRYDFSCAFLPLAKDPSDSVKNFGKEKTLISLVPSIHNALSY